MEDVRNIILSVTVSEKERAAITEKINKLGMSNLSEFIRLCTACKPNHSS